MNDGTGIGISPDLITAKQYREIVGVAWSATPAGSKIALINLAIGLNTNDIARMVEEQQSQISRLKKEFASLEKRISAIEAGIPIISDQLSEAPIDPADVTVYDEMQDVLDVEQIEDAILLLKDSYSARGIDVNTHLGLRKLYNDDTFRKDIIQQVQQSYQVTRGTLINMEGRK